MQEDQNQARQEQAASWLSQLQRETYLLVKTSRDFKHRKDALSKALITQVLAQL